MQLRHLQHLNDDEIKTLIDAPVLIGLLIAGSDGVIDEKEKHKAIQIAHFRSQNTDSILHDYYVEVDKYYEDSFEQLASVISDDTMERNHYLIKRLETLNEILPKIDKEYAKELYKGMLSYARHVAESSGGLLGFGAVNPSEQEFINLPMINEVK
jgi:hypothetical protein